MSRRSSRRGTPPSTAGPGAASAGRTAPDAARDRTAPDAARDRSTHTSPVAWRSLLLAITAVAAALRIVGLTHVPPGLNQDEAIGSWISWCLLKTGRDMTGQSWPIFYTRGIGDYSSTLFLYLTMPFQALGGLNVWTARLPTAVGGVLCVPLVAYVGARLFDRRVGLAAALLLALNPWHVFISRFGVGAALCSLFALLAVALLLAARLPLGDGAGQPPRPVLALAGGLAAGLACYGYPPLRIYFPALFALLALFQWRGQRQALAAPAPRAALLAAAAGFAVPFVPLFIVHLVDPHIAHRWEMTRLWDPGATPLEIAQLVLVRYLQHFSPDFLFVRGDRFTDVNPLMAGAFPWVVLPLFLAGAWLVVARARSSAAARTLAALVLAYPAGDLVARYVSVHSQRSAAGAGTLALLAALGAVALWDLAGRTRWRPAIAGLAAALVIGAHGRDLVRFFREFDRSGEIYHAYHVDLLEAMRWLKPRLDQYDAVFCTAQGMNEPFAIALVGLDYDPRRWFAEPRDVRMNGEWEVTARFGKLWFGYDNSWRVEYDRLAAAGRHARVLFITRPGESDLAVPIETIHRPNGEPTLVIGERQL